MMTWFREPWQDLWQDEQELLFGERSVLLRRVVGCDRRGSLEQVLFCLEDKKVREGLAWMVVDLFEKREKRPTPTTQETGGAPMIYAVEGQRIVFCRWRRVPKIRAAEIQRVLSLWGCLNHAQYEEWVLSRRTASSR